MHEQKSLLNHHPQIIWISNWILYGEYPWLMRFYSEIINS